MPPRHKTQSRIPRPPVVVGLLLALVVIAPAHAQIICTDLYTLGKPSLQPISVGIQQFNFIYSQQPHLIQATALLGMVVPVLLFFFSQRFFMRGIVITGVEK